MNIYNRIIKWWLSFELSLQLNSNKNADHQFEASRHGWLWSLILYLSYQSCFCEVKLRLDWKHTEGKLQLMTWKSVKVVWNEKNCALGGPWRLPRIWGKKRRGKRNNNEFFKSTTLKCNSAQGGTGGGAPPFKKWWLSKQSCGGGALLRLFMALNLWSLIVSVGLRMWPGVLKVRSLEGCNCAIRRAGAISHMAPAWRLHLIWWLKKHSCCGVAWTPSSLPQHLSTGTTKTL